MNNFERENFEPKASRAFTLRKIVVPVVAFFALAGVGCTSNEQSDIGKYDDDKVEGVESITLCDGAKIRKDPRVPEKDEGDNTIHRVDFGDAPDGSCFEFKVGGNVYKTYQNSGNGNWIGMPYRDWTDLVDGFNKKGELDIAWVNQAKAGVEEPGNK